MSRRAAWACTAAILAMIAPGCGAPERDEVLGVQSNRARVDHQLVLRVRPAAPIAFATQLTLRVSSEMFGEPMRFDLDSRGVRRVTPQPDGALAVEELDTQRSFVVSMMGETRPSPDAQESGEPRRYTLGERGEIRLDPGAAPQPGSGAPGDSFARALEPIVRALEFPDEPVDVGSEWGETGVIDLREVDPGMDGRAEFELRQRLDRFEGSGEDRVAVIAVVGRIAGEGVPSASGMPVMPGAPPSDERLRGWLSYRGFYVVALSDGFARVARGDVEGSVEMGSSGMLVFPIRGSLEWTATPTDAALPLASRAPSAP